MFKHTCSSDGVVMMRILQGTKVGMNGGWCDFAVHIYIYIYIYISPSASKDSSNGGENYLSSLRGSMEILLVQDGVAESVGAPIGLRKATL